MNSEAVSFLGDDFGVCLCVLQNIKRPLVKEIYKHICSLTRLDKKNLLSGLDNIHSFQAVYRFTSLYSFLFKYHLVCFVKEETVQVMG